MRPTLFLPLLCFFSLSVTAQNSKSTRFILKGKITGSQHPVVYLTYGNEGKQIKDSCLIKQGTFYFKGDISEPVMATVRGNDKTTNEADNPNIAVCWLEPATLIEADVQYDHFKEIKITGSRTQLEYETLEKQFTAVDLQSTSAGQQFSAIARKFIVNHPNSYVSVFWLSIYKSSWSMDSVKNYYAKLTPFIQNSIKGKGVKALIDEADRTAVGTMAAVFETVDINGRQVKLSDFKGKYVVLDFWGSWCGPCRQSTPHLKEVFKKYKNNGLDVIAVAEEYDETDIAWREAIKRDGTEIWYNVLNDKKADKDIVKMFGVHTFPTKILIDRTGKIIGRYKGTEDGPAMDKKLSELFD